MKAYVLNGINDLNYDNVQIPEIDNGSVLLKVKASGICSSDIPRIFINGTYHFPTIPGHEFSGQIVKVNNEQDKYLIGKRVGVFPLIPCFECEQCKNKKYEICSNYNYLGSRCDGGFAEFVKVPKWNIIELPDSVSFKEAAMLEPMSVAMHAVKIANIAKNSKVAVVGTGMIGISIAQFASYFAGQTIDLFARNNSKRDIVDQFKDINYLVEEIPNNVYDYIFEVVGSSESIISTIDKSKPGSTIVFVGNPSGDLNLPKATYWKILR